MYAIANHSHTHCRGFGKMLIWKGLTPSRLAKVLAWLAQAGHRRDVAPGERPAGYSTAASQSIKD